MRTKNFNLKKKIAFIASVTMIATTAAYLPAEVAQNIGIGSGIVASAAAADSTAATIDTFDAYVKVNGKYLAIKSGKTELYSSVAAATADGATSFTQIDRTQLFNYSPIDGDTTNYDATNDVMEIKNSGSLASAKTSHEKLPEKYKKLYNQAEGLVTLPADIKPGSTIEVEVVAKSTASVVSDSNTVEVTLDEHGMAQVAEQKKLIEVQGDDYVAAHKNESGADVAATGNREFIDLTGLRFQVNPATATYQGVAINSEDTVKRAFSATTTTDGPKIEAAAAASDGKGFSEVVANAADAETAKPYEYAYVAAGDSFARNFVGTLDNVAEPGTTITVDLGVKNNWTVTGTNVDATTKKLTLTLGNDGKVTSDVITVTKGDVVEKYVITVLNHATSLDNTKIKTSVGTFGVTTSAKAWGSDTTALDITTKTDNYKVTSETDVQTVGTSKKFVEVYTVASNTTTTAAGTFNFEVDADTGVTLANSASVEYTITQGNASTNGHAYTVVKKVKEGNTVLSTANIELADVTETGGNKIEVYSDLPDAAKTSVDAAKYTKIAITSEEGKGANAESAVMDFSGSKFQIVLTNKYDLKVDNDNYGTGKAEYGKASVTGVTVTKPAEPTKGGYTFKEYQNDDGHKIFSAGVPGQQTEAPADINPNMTLKAIYEANRYKLVQDANGGTFVAVPNSSYTKTAFDSDNNATELTLETTSSGDTSVLTTVADGTNIKRNGYTLVGWSTDKNATEDDKLDKEAYDAERPTEVGGTIKLYAIWKATPYNVNWGTIDLNADGTSADETVSGTYLSAAPTFASGVNTTLSVKTGEAFGELPTPEKKGFEFVGWYYKTLTNPLAAAADQKYAATPVTATTKLSYEDIESGTLRLYAKFKQKEYTVTYDYDGGSLRGADTNPIATFKLKKNGDVLFFDEKGADITAKVTANADKVYDAKKGSGEYYIFEGWTINDGTTKVANSSLASTIKALTTIDNITLKANYRVASGVSTQGMIAFDTNGGKMYKIANKGNASTVTYTIDSFSGISGAKNALVSSNATIDGANITYSANDYIVSRPGYTFTGWYSDADCKTSYTFDKYPDGTETVVYAGWKANTSTRYQLHFNLVKANGSFVSVANNEYEANKDTTNANDKEEYSYTTTFMGTTGSTVSAKDKTFTYNGVEYVYDPQLSANANSEAELKVEYKMNGTNAALVDGHNFTINSDKYTVIQGYFKEKGSESKELGTATNVAVKDGTVTWTAADNADHYRIQKTVNGKTYYGAKVTAAKATYTVPVEEHEIAVVAYNADESEKTVSTVVKVAASTKLGKATNVKCAEDGTVTFSAATGATKYQVAKVVNGKTYYSAKSDATSIKISPATEDFEVYVIAFDSTGKLSTHSDTIKVSAAASTLEAVDDATITVDGEGKVTWTAAKGAVAYKVFKITKNSEGKEVTNWGSKVTTTSYTFKDLPTTDYKVYVAAIDANGKVKYSAKKKISTLPAATNVKLSADKKTVSWTAPTGTNADKIVKYQVAKFDTAANKTAYSVKVDAPATSITMKNAAVAGTKIFVLAFDADGNSSYSASIDVK